MIIKLADISNETRDIEISEPWIDRLLQEFFHQSELEKAEGIPVTPFMDPDKVNKPASQVSFISRTLEPTLDALGTLFPQLVDTSNPDSLIASTTRTLSFYQQLRDQHDGPPVVLEHQPATQTVETAVTEKSNQNHLPVTDPVTNKNLGLVATVSRKSSRTGSLPCAVHYDVRESSILRAARNRNNHSNPHIHVPPTPPPEPEVAVAVAQPRFREDYEFEDN